MDRRITGFHQDAELHWIAELECGHGQHVRHNPPWQLRPWVVEAASRNAHLGTLLPCRACDDLPAQPESSDAYSDARLRGLCHDGALEAGRAKLTLGRPREPAE